MKSNGYSQELTDEVLPIQEVSSTGAVYSAVQPSLAFRETEVKAYRIIRYLAMRGDLGAFVALHALDFEKTPAAFEETVLREGEKWLARPGMAP